MYVKSKCFISVPEITEIQITVMELSFRRLFCSLTCSFPVCVFVGVTSWFLPQQSTWHSSAHHLLLRYPDLSTTPVPDCSASTGYFPKSFQISLASLCSAISISAFICSPVCPSTFWKPGETALPWLSSVFKLASQLLAVVLYLHQTWGWYQFSLII